MAHLGVFPYCTNEAGEGYIFSALNVECSIEDIEAAFTDKTISETYKNLLIGNLWDAETGEKDAYFASVE